MALDTVQPKLEGYRFIDPEKNQLTCKKSRSANIYVFFMPFVIFLFLASMIYVFIEVNSLKNRIEYLNEELEYLKKYTFEEDSDLTDDIQRFANDEFYSDDDAKTDSLLPTLVSGGDDLLFDYDMHYNDYVDNDFHELIKDESNEDDKESNPESEDLKSLMNGGSLVKIATENKRNKRDIVASTFEGVPIISESYADVKIKNSTRNNSGDNFKLYDSLKPVGGDGVHSAIPNIQTGYPSSAWINKHHTTHGLTHYEQLETKHSSSPAPVASRQSRVMYTEDKSKSVKKVAKKPQVKSGSQYESGEEQIGGPDVTIVRDDQFGFHHRRNRHRQRNNLETFDERRVGKSKTLPAIHFSGDTSRYVVGRHTNYNGDGHLRHPDQTYVDWSPNNWVKALGTDQHFQMHNGYLKIKENGLYLVYAQIYYLDEHDTNGFRVHKNQETLLQCTSMTHSTDRVIKGNTCYTAGVEYLNEGDEISLKDLANGRYSLFEPGKSFFGVVKLGEARMK